MEYRRFGDDIVVRIDKGEEIIQKMLEVCEKEKVILANINALGAVGEFEVGLFKTDEKKYYSEVHKGDFEIVSLTGSITTKEGKLYHHIHMSAGDKENKVYGGHLNYAKVSATCEMFIRVISGNVEREFNEEIGLNLFKF
jgi:predicted DNA-binding protein with PD1-like motif